MDSFHVQHVFKRKQFLISPLKIVLQSIGICRVLWEYICQACKITNAFKYLTVRRRLQKILDLCNRASESLAAGGLHHRLVVGLNNLHQINTLPKHFKGEESELFRCIARGFELRWDLELLRYSIWAPGVTWCWTRGSGHCSVKR